MKRILCTMLAFTLLVSMACASAETNSTGQSITAGSLINFGHYPQNSGGKDNSLIRWLVLEVRDNHALIISQYGLDCQSFHRSKEEITWEQSDLRVWLNDTFYNRAFSSADRKAILTARVSNTGNSTEDKVFLLSYEEAGKHLSPISMRRCTPTEYAKEIEQSTGQELGTSETVKALTKPTGRWWLRTTTSEGWAKEVDLYGCRLNAIVVYALFVRPVLWLDLSTYSQLGYSVVNQKLVNGYSKKNEPTDSADGRFSFRGGITWGMGLDEITDIEGDSCTIAESKDGTFIMYNPIQVSKYAGVIIYCLFSGRLVLAQTVVPSGQDEGAYEYLRSALDKLYGSRLSYAEIQAITGLTDIEDSSGESAFWLTADGTIIQIQRNDLSSTVYISYMSEDLRKMIADPDSVNTTGL